MTDRVTGRPLRVLAVKGSGGDLRSITAAGFALLHQEMLEKLVARYRGEAHEDEMVDLYPLCAANGNRVAASIDTPLHALLPFAHRPSAFRLGDRHRRERQRRAQTSGVQRALRSPSGGHVAAARFRTRDDDPKAVAAHPGCDGSFSRVTVCPRGDTQQVLIWNSIRTIDQMGEFVEDHARRRRQPLFGGPSPLDAVGELESTAAQIRRCCEGGFPRLAA